MACNAWWDPVQPQTGCYWSVKVEKGSWLETHEKLFFVDEQVCLFEHLLCRHNSHCYHHHTHNHLHYQSNHHPHLPRHYHDRAHNWITTKLHDPHPSAGPIWEMHYLCNKNHSFNETELTCMISELLKLCPILYLNLYRMMVFTHMTSCHINSMNWKELLA